MLLKLRKKIEKIRSKDNMEELQTLVIDDIMSTIRKNEAIGNLSSTDALDLIEMTTKLYMKIYSKYKELEEFTMRMVDQSLELASDKYEKTVEELEDIIKEKDQIIQELERQLKEAQKQS